MVVGSRRRNTWVYCPVGLAYTEPFGTIAGVRCGFGCNSDHLGYRRINEMNNTLTTLRDAASSIDAYTFSIETGRCICCGAYEHHASCGVLKSINSINALIASMEAQPEQVSWKHDCAALLQNDVELWVARCPHCGKPHDTHPAQPSEPKAEPAHDDLTIAYMSGFHDGKKAKAEPVRHVPAGWRNRREPKMMRAEPPHPTATALWEQLFVKRNP